MSQLITENRCSEPDCGRPVRCRGRCKSHYEQWRKVHRDLVDSRGGRWDNPDGSRMTCQVEGCEFEVSTQGMCSHHYQNFHYLTTRGADKSRRNRKLTPYGGVKQIPDCTFPGCDRVEFNPGLCAGHYYQRLGGKELTPINGTNPCPITGCTETYKVATSKRGLCPRHSAESWRFGLDTQTLVELHRNRVCANPGCNSIESLHIDHDHSCCGREKPGRKVSCGQCVRGWLCASCNLSLGRLKEDVRRIRGLADYIESWNRTSTS